MAKKKKKSTNKSPKKDIQSSTSTFWAYTAAIILFLLAFFILLGGFKSGGILPVDLFHATYWLLGWGAYVLPIFLVYYGIYKFKTEDHRVPLANLISTLVAIIFISGLFFVSFVSKNQFNNFIGGHGGQVGALIGGLFLSVLDIVPATILFIVIGLLAIFFAFGISPSVFINLFEYLKRKKEDNNELAMLKDHASQAGFKLNEGVPVEHHDESLNLKPPSTRLSSFKNFVMVSPTSFGSS